MAYFYFFFIQNFLEKISLFSSYVNVLPYFIEWSLVGIAAASGVASLLEQKGIQCPCC